MRNIVITGALFALVALPLRAQQTGPVIMKGGSHSPVPNPTFAVLTDLTYKVAWDIKVGSPKPGESNAAFEVPARFLNQSVGAGVPRANIQVAVVVHGSAGEELLNNEEYRARKGVDNPNIALLEEMSKAGVRIIICGQTVAGRKMPREKILSFVEVSPSATWAHAVLQKQGYTLNPF
ncbi:MAG: DsrE family protein [Gemmatimonadetes bacterium]|nr:DsrE family protein [Gemmatimonadota bacterium]